jgi:PAS domain S-box-containing protein
MLNKLLPRLDRLLLIVFPFFIILLIASYVYIDNIQKRNTIYFNHNDKLNILMELNTYFNDFIHQNVKFIMFDEISTKLNEFEDTLNFLMEDAEQNNLDYGYKRNLKNIQKVFLNKKLQIERLKARKAFAYNTLTYLLDSSDLGYTSLNKDLRNQIDIIRIVFANILLDLDSLEKLTSEINTLENKAQSNGYIDNFIKLTQAFIGHYTQINNTMHKIGNIDIHLQLNGIKANLYDISQREKQESEYIVNVSFLIILIFSILILFGTWRLYKTRKELVAFKTAVENSHSVVVMTDINQKITFVNDTFEKVTGYSAKEAIGLKPNVLKSGIQDERFYKDMADKIFSGHKWHGRFVNKKKNGEIFYEDATITPIIMDGEIDSYLAIKLDVTQLVNYSNELADLNNSLEKKVEEKIALLRQKDVLLQQQSRLAALGEMIGNIAHQWRQPLSSITIGASGIKYKKELDILKLDEQFDKEMDNIIAGAEYLSQTIEDFRNFTKVDTSRKLFDINETIQNTYKIVENLYRVNSIKVEFDLCSDMLYKGIQSQFSQVVINILNNAKDALIANNQDKDNRKIVITTISHDLNLIIRIADNAGGISEDIMSKFFDPYFTTKHQSKGTGIGLFMTHEIVKNNFSGTIEVKNEAMIVGDKEYIGAVFYIIFPKVIDESQESVN